MRDYYLDHIEREARVERQEQRNEREERRLDRVAREDRYASRAGVWPSFPSTARTNHKGNRPGWAF